MEVKLHGVLGNYDRSYDRQTNRPTDRQTDRPGHREVSLPIKEPVLVKVENVKKIEVTEKVLKMVLIDFSISSYIRRKDEKNTISHLKT